ncbi:MAG: hypothetical protein B7Z72_06360 [Gemmatimonadetes bacterium 21-71-4]|nr:MAG: hypothetical protein B7Z72_06360 [Gemmatimonadetes bacterium 21-71-4]
MSSGRAMTTMAATSGTALARTISTLAALVRGRRVGPSHGHSHAGRRRSHTAAKGLWMMASVATAAKVERDVARPASACATISPGRRRSEFSSSATMVTTTNDAMIGTHRVE